MGEGYTLKKYKFWSYPILKMIWSKVGGEAVFWRIYKYSKMATKSQTQKFQGMFEPILKMIQ